MKKPPPIYAGRMCVPFHPGPAILPFEEENGGCWQPPPTPDREQAAEGGGKMGGLPECNLSLPGLASVVEL